MFDMYQSAERDFPTVHRDEAAKLFGALDFRHRPHGRVIEVLGEPGAGKTRLLAGFAAEAARRGLPVVSGRCSQAEQASPLRPIVHVLAALHVKESSQDLEPETVRSLLTQHAGSGLVLVLDDFHWVDPATVRLVADLAVTPLAARVLLVIAQRPRQASGVLRKALAEAGAPRIELGPLTAAQAAEILELPPKDPRLRALYGQSEGLPLYLLALANGHHPGTGELAEPELLDDHYGALLLAEFASLDRADLAILSYATVLGENFTVDSAVEVTGLPPREIAAAFARLAEQDLLRQEEEGHTFRHPLLRAALYSSLDPLSRGEAHRRALARLTRLGAPATERAPHIERSVGGVRSADLITLIDAARRALHTAPADAARWLGIVVGLLPRETEISARLHVLLPLAQTLGVAGHLSKSRDLLHSFLSMIPPEAHKLRADAVGFCALMEGCLGSYDEALALLTAELAPATDHPRAEAVQLRLMLATVNVVSGRVSAGEAQAEVARRLGLQQGNELVAAGALAVRGLCEALSGKLSLARQTTAEAAAALDAQPQERLEFLAVVGWAELLLGDFTQADRHLRLGVTIAWRRGHRYLLPLLLCGISVTSLNCGTLAEAQELAIEAAKISADVGAQHLHGLALALMSLSTTWLGTGAMSEAVDYAEQAVAKVPAGECLWHSYAVLSLARATLVSGDPLRCTVLVGHAGGPGLRGITPVFRPIAVEILTAAALEAGLPGKMPDLLPLTTTGLPVQTAYALMAQANVLHAQRQYEASSKLHVEAADRFGAHNMQCARARNLTLAARCRAHDSPDTAATLLRMAKQAARSCGSLTVYRAADAQERRGKRLSTPAQRPGQLTEREWEVAALASTGEKTKAIAGCLGLSPRTVDVHLTRIYRKLNVSSRAELASLLPRIAVH